MCGGSIDPLSKICSACGVEFDEDEWANAIVGVLWGRIHVDLASVTNRELLVSEIVEDWVMLEKNTSLSLFAGQIVGVAKEDVAFVLYGPSFAYSRISNIVRRSNEPGARVFFDEISVDELIRLRDGFS